MIQPFISFDDLQKLSPEQIEVCNIYATMVMWARAFFSEQAHMPHDEKDEDYSKSLSRSMASLTTIATQYRILYMQFCERYKVLKPTENYLTAIQHMDGIAGWLKAKQQGCDLVTVKRSIENRNGFGEWQVLSNQQMHERIMKVYASYRAQIAARNAAKAAKTKERGSAVGDWELQD